MYNIEEMTSKKDLNYIIFKKKRGIVVDHRIMYNYAGMTEVEDAAQDILSSFAEYYPELSGSLKKIHVWKYWMVSFINGLFHKDKIGIDFDNVTEVESLLENITIAFEDMLLDVPDNLDVAFYHTITDEWLLFVVEIRPDQMAP